MDSIASAKSQGGSLLLEVLISLLIFSFAILGLAAMQTRAVQFSVEAEDRNRAALLVNEMVSVMWAQQTTDSSALTTQIAAWRGRVKAALPPFDDHVTATVSAADSSGVVTITVGWKPVGGKETAGVDAASAVHTYSTRIAMP